MRNGITVRCTQKVQELCEKEEGKLVLGRHLQHSLYGETCLSPNGKISQVKRADCHRYRGSDTNQKLRFSKENLRGVLARNSWSNNKEICLSTSKREFQLQNQWYNERSLPRSRRSKTIEQNKWAKVKWMICLDLDLVFKRKELEVLDQRLVNTRNAQGVPGQGV